MAERSAAWRRWLSPIVHLSGNWISRVGIGMVTTATVLFLFLLPSTLQADVQHPYLGIAAFLVLPGLFFAGLALIPLGIWLRLRRERRAGVYPLRLEELPARAGELRRLITFIIVMTIINIGIDRQDRARKVSVLANSATGVSLGAAVEAMDAIIAANPPPPGIELVVEGQARRMAETAIAIGFAFLLALIALYIVLASQFDRFGQPFLIMLTAPLSFSGAFVAMLIGGQEMSLFGQIGLLALMGIVMKNGILLVDRANQLVESGVPRADAMAQAAPERLRPVLMTALAAIFGMIPVALASSDGSEWRNAMGFIVIGGLITSTMLTLVVVPAAWMLPEDAARLWRQLVRRSPSLDEGHVRGADSLVEVPMDSEKQQAIASQPPAVSWALEDR